MIRPLRLLALLTTCLALATAPSAAANAAQPTPPTVAEQNDRRLRNLPSEQAERTQAAVAISEAEQRRIARVPDPFVPPAPTALDTKFSPAAPSSNVDALATLLLGLLGGLVGGAAAVIGWTTSTRRRLRQPASTA